MEDEVMEKNSEYFSEFVLDDNFLNWNMNLFHDLDCSYFCKGVSEPENKLMDEDFPQEEEK